MTPAEQAKAAGLKSLAQVAELTGVSHQTLRNWHKSKPDLFRIVLAGCLMESRPPIYFQEIGRAHRLNGKPLPIVLDYRPIEMSELRARAVLVEVAERGIKVTQWYFLNRMGLTYPALKEEFSSLDWDAFARSAAELNSD